MHQHLRGNVSAPRLDSELRFKQGVAASANVDAQPDLHVCPTQGRSLSAHARIFHNVPSEPEFFECKFFFFLFNCRRARVEASELVKQIITLLGQVLIRANPLENSLNDYY